MCVVSMVYGHYQPLFPKPMQPEYPLDKIDWSQILQPQIDLKELRKLVDEFKDAVAAALKIDLLTKQPDCVDPEKAKLSSKVAELEKKLDQIHTLSK